MTDLPFESIGMLAEAALRLHGLAAVSDGLDALLLRRRDALFRTFVAGLVPAHSFLRCHQDSSAGLLDRVIRALAYRSGVSKPPLAIALASFNDPFQSHVNT